MRKERRQAAQVNKSEIIRLDFPYDWSNPNMSDEALILNVLKKSRFRDVLKICIYYGIEKVAAVETLITQPNIKKSVKSILRNIRSGYEKYYRKTAGQNTRD